MNQVAGPTLPATPGCADGQASPPEPAPSRPGRLRVALALWRASVEAGDEGAARTWQAHAMQQVRFAWSDHEAWREAVARYHEVERLHNDRFIAPLLDGVKPSVLWE